MVARNLGISNYKSSYREFGSEVTRKIQSCCYNIPNGISPGQVEQIVTITRINLAGLLFFFPVTGNREVTDSKIAKGVRCPV